MAAENYTLVPKVDQTQEFIEIANDFSNPLDLVREAISNAFDQNAKNIEITFETIKESGEHVLMIILKDDGNGMDQEGLQSFFDLGNSLSRGNDEKIGEKGHGTKVYFNSSNIEVVTVKNGEKRIAVMENPIRKLHDRQIPEVLVTLENPEEGESNGTVVRIKGYNSNRREKFTHEQLKDYILWFTKMGSVELLFEEESNKDVKIYLKGLNKPISEVIEFGHPFPDENSNVTELFEKHLVAAPDFYCKRIVKRGHLRNFPDISYEAVFSIEGNKVKQENNKMIRRPGVAALSGSYTVGDRYGVWLCKDFIPIQRKNEWITYKGNEFTKLHAFFNCQGLRLTANRGSIDNTPSEILLDIQNEIKAIYGEIEESEDQTQLDWLEEEAAAYRTEEKEKKAFDWRVKKIRRANICEYKGELLVEPQRESGVYALVIQLSILEKNLFPFHIVDYDTHSGLDVIVKGDDKTPVYQSKLFYVEFKNYLTASFNHSFANLHNIICWDTELKHNDVLEDIGGYQRQLVIVQPANDKDYTKYFLDSEKSAHKIEVFVLKDYLRQKLGIEFRPRTDKDVL